MSDSMRIQVFGTGCPSCKRLFELTEQAVKESGINANVEYVTDIQKIIELGVMQSPVLAVNGVPVLTGFVPDIERIKELIAGTSSPAGDTPAKPSCCCGGKC